MTLAVPKVEKSRQDAVEALMRMADGSTGKVETEKDWQVLEAIFKLWAYFYQEEFREATRKHKELRKIAKNEFASTRDKGGAEIRHLIEWPNHLLRLIESIYPDQKTHDKKFVLKYVKKFRIFQVGAKI